jgi:hypothetical protein
LAQNTTTASVVACGECANTSANRTAEPFPNEAHIERPDRTTRIAGCADQASD